MNIINYNDKLFWSNWIILFESNSFQYPLYSENGLKYSIAYFNEISFENKSFIIVENSKPLVGIILSMEKNNGEAILSGFGRGIFYIENNSKNVTSLKAARKIFKKRFNEMWSSYNVKSIRFRDYSSISGDVSYFGKYLLDNNAVCSVVFPRIIDLTLTEEKIHSQLTKSCRNSVNWGLKNLNIKIFNHQNINDETFNKLRRLHIKEAGKETRSKSTWDFHYEMIKNNEAFLINGHYDDKVVSSALFIHNNQYCLYGVSASRRDLFEKPLSHAIIWKAILNAKLIGCKYFDFSVLSYRNNDSIVVSNKEKNINLFKKSFGGKTKSQLSIVWDSL
jgi:hypothetical protein